MACVLERYPIPSVLKCVHSYVRVNMHNNAAWHVQHDDHTRKYVARLAQSAGPAQAVGPVGLWPYHFYKLEILKN